MEATGKCQQCEGSITFAAEDVGGIIACPSCGLETQLQLPRTGKGPRTAAGPRKQEKPAALIEDTLEEIGTVFFVLGIISFLGCAVGGILAFVDDKSALGISLTISAIVSIGQGFIVKALFTALAEIIRLLRAIKAKP